MPIVPISKRSVVQIALAGGLAGAVTHWAAAQALPEACQALRRDLDAAAKARNLDAAKDANRKIQTGVGCNPLRIDAKAAMLGLYQEEDARLEKAGASPAQRLAALTAALVGYGNDHDWEPRLRIADLKRQLAESGGPRDYADISQAYYAVLQAAAKTSPSMARPSAALLERVAMLAYQYQAISTTPVKGRGLYTRDVRGIFVGRVPVPLQFVYNEDNLTDLGRAEAEKMVKALKEENNPRIHLVGHTDPKGSDAYNLELSVRRAEAIKKFLIAHGYPPHQITVEGRGKREVEAFMGKIVDAKRFSEEAIHQILRRVEIVQKQ
jgi:outer membrane protein OmpA-like peptidoglycan-associated protein